jgi:hypothetical protein
MGFTRVTGHGSCCAIAEKLFWSPRYSGVLGRLKCKKHNEKSPTYQDLGNSTSGTREQVLCHAAALGVNVLDCVGHGATRALLVGSRWEIWFPSRMGRLRAGVSHGNRLVGTGGAVKVVADSDVGWGLGDGLISPNLDFSVGPSARRDNASGRRPWRALRSHYLIILRTHGRLIVLFVDY